MKTRKSLIKVLLICISFALNSSLIIGQGYSRFDVTPLNGNSVYSYNQVPDALVPYNATSPGTFQWERSLSPVNGFEAIADATLSTYSFSAPLQQTTYFRRRTTISGLLIYYSNVVKIEVVSVNHENINYLREHDVLVPGQTDWKAIDVLPIGQKLQTTTYLDGIGRPVQKVSRETATPDPAQPNNLWGDVVQFFKYDALGRQTVQYLPYTTTTESGKYKSAPLAEQPQYYSNVYDETSAFSTSTYDNSPLNRVMNVRSPGTSWANGPGNSTLYDLNDATDDVQIFSVGYGSGDVPVSLGAYPAKSLFKTVHTDEKGKKVVEYVNQSGQLILKKVQIDDNPSAGHQGWICVYSVYDDFGLLRWRLQPEGVKYLEANGWSFAGTNGQKVRDEFCFRYEYDEKGRNTQKKAPGAKELKMLYDGRDRVVFMQDGNQRTKSPGEWTANLYDELDRVVITTLYHTTKSVAALQSDIESAATTSTVTVAGQGSANANLVVDIRQAGISQYTAQNTIEFTTGFESMAGDEFVAELNASAGGQPVNVTTVTYKNPIAAADLNNASVSTIVKYNFYDDYSYGTVKPFSTSFDNGLAYTTGDPIAKSLRTINLSTGSMVRVLGTGTFLTTTVYYDEKGRPIQTSEDNLKSGTDITTHQYQFDGRLLSSNTRHSAAGSGYSGFSIVTKNLFDKIGRVTGIEKKYGTNPFKAIASYGYDDMGRLKTKRLDPGYTATGKNELESLGYSYNIHNEITGINKDYALKTPGKYDKWGSFFGLYLGFDNRDGVFASAQLNGQVTGTLWTTQGDDAQRKYDFTYDHAGRLTSALFNEKQKSGDGWSNAAMDFSVTGSGGKITYDLNGNLLSMLQKGVVPGTAVPVTIDELQYTYAALSNKLMRVSDNSTLSAANGRSGDFADGGNGNTDDYVYDDNGNLVVDLNKNAKELAGVAGANGIRYNFLDKPEEVHIAGKGTIKMVYDADGNKLQKVFTPEGGTTTTATTTTYVNEFIYRGNELQYINFEEGRIRVMQAVSQNNGYDLLTLNGNMDLPGGKRGAYDFFIRDYQSNVRMILTEETHLGSNSCTMELQRAANEEPLFGQVDANGNPSSGNEVAARFAVGSIPGQASGNGWQNPAIGSHVSRIGNLTGKQVGPNTLLKVMAGDEVSATTMYYYQNAVTNQSGGASVLTNLLVSLAQAISGSGVTSGLTKTAATGITSQLNSSVPFSTIADPDAANASGNNPKAYLSVMFFDERFRFVEEGSVTARVSQSGSGAPALVLANIKAPKNGYAYVYVSNTSDEMVYFDNLQVAHNRGRIMEENHYYAYGLKIASISSRKLPDASEGHTRNTDLYNDKELIEDADLNWYDYGFRNYDPQIGRFPQLDPLTDEYPELTPYQYASNDPITNIDIDGLEGGIATTAATAKILPTFTVTAKISSASSSAFKIGGLLRAGASLVANTTKLVKNTLTAENLSKAGEVLADFTPIVGGAKDIYQGYQEGNGWKVTMGVGFIALDVVTLGGGSVVRGGIKTVVKAGTEVLIKHGAEQVAMQTIRKGGNMAFKAANAVTAKGFRSFTEFKRVMGSAGLGQAWHHIVEQTPGNIIKYGNQSIHNINNLIKLPHGKGSIHAKVSGYYSSIQPFTGGKTVRQWISTKSYTEQFEFGLQTLKNFGWTP